MTITRQRLDRIEDCRSLYFKYDGGQHELIESEMRALGHTDFHRRVMYRRFERGMCRSGWIERFGWEQLLKLNREKAKKAAKEQTPTDEIATPKAQPPSPPDPILETPIHNDLNSFIPVKRSSEDEFEEFKVWLKRVSPNMNWEWKYQVQIYRQLKKVYTGELKRLMIFLPPRHGKSELVTVRFTAFCMKQDPSKNVILGSYNQQLANRFSRKIRRVLTDEAAADAMDSGQLIIDNSGTQSSNTCQFPGQCTTHSSASDKPKTETSPSNCQSSIANSQLGQAANNCQLSTVNCPFAASANDCQSSIANSQLGQAANNCQLSTVNCPFAAAANDYQFVAAAAPMFPFASSRPKNTEAEWETAAGGGLRAVGAGAGITGFGGDLVIIDDPVKSRAEAESKVIRDKVWDWFNDDIYTRLERDAAIILIQTRWHEDDLAGRLLRESKEEGREQWTVINLPAFAEGNSPIGNGRSHERIDNGQLIIDNKEAAKDVPPRSEHYQLGELRSHAAIDNGRSHERIDNGRSHERIDNGQSHERIDNGQLIIDNKEAAKDVPPRSEHYQLSTINSQLNVPPRSANSQLGEWRSQSQTDEGRSITPAEIDTGQLIVDNKEGADVISIAPRSEKSQLPSINSQLNVPPRSENYQLSTINSHLDVPIAPRSENSQLSTINSQLDVPPRSENYQLSTINSQLIEDLRLPGEPLCPERFDAAALGRIRERLGSYSFSALYQQRPTPAEGGLFKRKWFVDKIIAAAPAGLRWKRGTDPGINRSSTSDFTASVRVAFDSDGNMYIDGVFRRQVEYPELKRYILGRIAAEPGTEHGVELSANGNAIVQDIKRDSPGAYLRGIEVKADKITRALPWLALAEAGKVYLVQGVWNDEYIDELAAFPTGQHDDQVDATSIAFRMATKAKKAFYVF